MSLVPSKTEPAIAFFEQHWPVWQANSAQIGVTAGQVTAVKTAAENARAKLVLSQTARMTATTATQVTNAAVGTMREVGATTIAVIKTYAETTNNLAVYDLANLPRPSGRSAGLPPGKPFDVSASIEPSGALTIRWKADNSDGDRRATGVFYQVFRKLAGETTFAAIGGSGTRAFTDESLPFGVDGVAYIVQGVRGTLVGGASEVFSVQFGSVGAGGGGFTIAATSGSDEAAKEAA